MRRRYDVLGLAFAIAALVIATIYPAAAAQPAQTQPERGSPVIIDGTHIAALSKVTRQLEKVVPASSRPRLQSPKPIPPLGSTVDFWAWDFATGSFYPVATTLQRLSEQTELYVQAGYPISAETLDGIMHTVDSVIVNREHKAFGHEPDPGIDEIARTVIVLLDIRDAQYYGRGGPLVGGYFWAINEYLQSTIDEWYPNANLKSNEREMILVDLSATTPGSREFYQVVSHEFQHLIHWNYDPDEDDWINEGMSDLAAQLSGFGLPGGHVQAFLDSPNRNVTRATDSPLADYGAYGLFGLFLWERYGADAISNAIVQTPVNGIDGLDAAFAGRNIPDQFAQIVSHWAVANFLDDLDVYGYRAIDIVTQGADGITRYRRPAVTRQTIYPTGPLSTTVATWGADYITFDNLQPGDLVITLTSSISTEFIVNVVSSSTDDFANGTNVLREVSLRSGATTAVTIRGAGSTVRRVALIPVHISQSAEYGTLLYRAAIVARTTPTSPTATPTRTMTPAPTATPTRTMTPAPTATPSPTPTETLPQPPSPSYVVRLNCGGSRYTDGERNIWTADAPYTPGGAGYIGGQTYRVGSAIEGTTDDALYQSERWGMSAYRFDVPNGTYSVTLRFSENYVSQRGLRVFDVLIGGQPVLTNFDVFAAAGGKYRAYDRSFTVTVRDGRLLISFVARKSEPSIKAIAVQAIGP